MATTPPVPVPAQPLSVLQEILGIISIGATTASAISGGGEVAAGANIASALIAIAQKAISAHVAATGQPIDPAVLRPYQPIP